MCGKWLWLRYTHVTTHARGGGSLTSATLRQRQLEGKRNVGYSVSIKKCSQLRGKHCEGKRGQVRDIYVHAGLLETGGRMLTLGKAPQGYA